VHFGQIAVVPEKPGDEDDGLAVAAWDAESVVDRRGVEGDPVEGEEGFEPDRTAGRLISGEVGFRG
jgi:hypothetical protein